MQENHHSKPDAGNQTHPSIGDVPSPSETFGNLRNDSEPFRTMPKDSEAFGTFPKVSERNENHTLTVREVARMFETAGVARTERSIINWCQWNAQGIARLDAYFDPNERKYFITVQSVELAIAEEKAKAAKTQAPSEPPGTVPNGSEAGAKRAGDDTITGSESVGKLEKEVLDLKILNKGKDFFIEQLQKERDGFFDQLLGASRKVGELETKLLQLESFRRGESEPTS